jgi:hypothetical protein
VCHKHVNSSMDFMNEEKLQPIEDLEVPSWLMIVEGGTCNVSLSSLKKKKRNECPSIFLYKPLMISPGIALHSEYRIRSYERRSLQVHASQHFICGSSLKMYLVQYPTQHKVRYYCKGRHNQQTKQNQKKPRATHITKITRGNYNRWKENRITVSSRILNYNNLYRNM